MANALSKDLHNQWEALQSELAAALDTKKDDGVTQALAKIDQFAQTNGIDKTKPVTEIGTAPAPIGSVDDLGFIKQGGWGSKSNNPALWKIVKMRDSPSLIKVVDEKNINVAANFKTQQGAQAFIDTCKKTGGVPSPSPPIPPSPSPSPSPIPAPTGSGRIVNKGGRVIKNGKVVVVFWGNWSSSPVSTTEIDNKFKAIFASDYFSKLTQYGVEKPTYLGTVSTNAAVPATVSDPDIVKVIGDLIGAGKVPNFVKENGDIIYVVLPPLGTPNKDKDGDAYHTDFSLSGNNKGVLATYYGKPDINSLTIALSEEVIEGLTNAGPGNDAWVDASGQEIGDVCDKAATVNGVQVETYWSNTDNKCVAGGGTVVSPPAPAPSPSPPAPSPSPSPPAPAGGNGLDQFGIKMIHPSKPGGQVVTTHAARYFTRHYSSGKPSEPTVEMDITGITFENQEVTAIIQMTGMSHPDTIDWKMRGGQHSSSNPEEGSCYDIEVMTDGSSKMTLEVEHPHPNNHPAHQPQKFNPGDLSKARFGWKGVTLNTPDGKGVLVESYINLTPDDQNGWKQYISVVDNGQLLKGFSPILKLIGNLAKVRIDGIIGKPTFDKVSCREITN